MKNVVFEPKKITPKDLLFGVIKMYDEFYSAPNMVKRTLNSLKLGFYPFFLVLERNVSVRMNMRVLTYSAKK